MFYVRKMCCYCSHCLRGGHVRLLLCYAVISALSILHLFSTRSFLLVGAQRCQLFENDLMATCERSKVSNPDLKARI